MRTEITATIMTMATTMTAATTVITRIMGPMIMNMTVVNDDLT